MGHGGEGNRHGGAAPARVREPEEAVRGENEEAGFEVREGSVRIVFTEKVNAREEEALNFVRFEYRTTASGEFH